MDFMLLNELNQINNIFIARGNILDLVLTDIADCKVFPASDILSKIDRPHPPLVLSINNVNRKNLTYNKEIRRYNFHKANYDLIKADLCNINWISKFESLTNVTDHVEILQKEIWKVIVKHVPLKKTFIHKYPPWFTSQLIKLLREKNNIRRRFNKYKNPIDKISFDLIKSRCRVLATTCYNHYIKGLEEDLINNPKLF